MTAATVLAFVPVVQAENSLTDLVLSGQTKPICRCRRFLRRRRHRQRRPRPRSRTTFAPVATGASRPSAAPSTSGFQRATTRRPRRRSCSCTAIGSRSTTRGPTIGLPQQFALSGVNAMFIARAGAEDEAGLVRVAVARRARADGEGPASTSRCRRSGSSRSGTPARTARSRYGSRTKRSTRCAARRGVRRIQLRRRGCKRGGGATARQYRVRDRPVQRLHAPHAAEHGARRRVAARRISPRRASSTRRRTSATGSSSPMASRCRSRCGRSARPWLRTHRSRCRSACRCAAIRLSPTRSRPDSLT